MTFLSLKDFLPPFLEFINHSTWTKKKRLSQDRLWNELNQFKSIEIVRKAGIYSLFYVNDFTVIRVPPKKTGYLMPYRGKLVLILATHRFVHNFHIVAFPLQDKAVNENLYNQLKASVCFKVPKSPEDIG